MKNNFTLLIFLIVTNLGFSQIFNWSPTAISGDWNFPFNWVEGIPVDGASNIVFNNNAQLVSTNNLTPLGAGFSIADITFSAGATSDRTIDGASEYIIRNRITNSSTGTHSINFPIAISGSMNIQSTSTGSLSFGSTINNTGGPLILAPTSSSTFTFNGVISGTSDVDLQGNGITYFKSPNTYSGSTHFSAGTLVLQADLTNSAIQQQGASTLSIDGANIHLASLNGGSSLSTVSLTSGSSLTTSGNFFNPGFLTLNANTSLTVNGNLSQVLSTMTLNTNTTVNVTGNFTVNNNLIIPSGATVNVTGNLSNGGGIITIQPGGKLTVGGDYLRANQVDMVINADATGSGSFIISGANHTAEVAYNHFLTGAGKWHLIASPTIGNPAALQDISHFITSFGAAMTQSGVKYSLAPYDNTGIIDVSTWKHYTTDGSNPAPATAFVQGKGYEILMNASQTVNFTGTIPTATVSIDLTEGLSTWNLIGNPYPSSIFANMNAEATNNFLTVNSAALDPSFVAMYVWNPTNGSYDIVNQASASRSLAPGQGFFVKAVTGGSTANFTPAMRTHQSANLFQKVQTTGIPTIVLSADNNNGVITNTEIKYMGGTSLGLDAGFDAGRFGAVGSGFGIYTRLVEDNGVDFTLQVVPDNTYNTTIIPLGLDATTGTQITFKANATDLPLGKKVFIEDKLLNTFAELNNTDKFYTATLASPSAGIGRFFIHTQDNLSTLGVSDFTKSKFTLVASPTTNSIKVFGLIEQAGSLEIYDSLGRKIHTAKLQAGTSNELQVPSMATGVYFVKVKAATSGTYTQKIVWY